MGTERKDDATSPYEMRLALVLNGGVSLAVWMGGVTAEIDRIRRAAYPQLASSTDIDRDPVLKEWNGLLAALGVRLNVDVIAGASAGGLNGAVLAAAIARGRPLPELKQVWHGVGSIENLASNVGQPAGDRRSLLNGNLLTTSVAGVFAGIEDRQHVGPASLREALESEETMPRGVTLFTTATSMRGEAEWFGDSSGQRFPQVEYRVLCRFRRPLLGDDEFGGTDANARLTRAARASASFPAAFEPTFFRAGEEVAANGDGAAQVSMRDTAGISASRWMIDGGVLDNEPFAPVLDRIALRAITQDVDRVVAYIDPEDAGVPTGDDAIDAVPGMIGTVSAALNLPRETNLLNQLDRVVEMERGIAVRLDGDVDLLAAALGGHLDAAAAALEPVYGERQDEAIAHEIRLARDGVRPADDPAMPADRLDLPSGEGAPDGSWPHGITAAERVLRMALALTRSEAVNGHNTTEVANALYELSVALIQLAQLRQLVVREAVASLPSDLTDSVSSDAIAAAVSAAMTAGRRAVIASVVAGALMAFVTAGAWPGPAATPAGDEAAQREAFLEACAKIEIVTRCAAPIGAYHPVPRFRFCRFGANVGTPYFCDGAPIKQKLMGLRLAHFGGFLDSDWRDYDWMWGRLDGATQLVRMLLGRLKAEPPIDAVAALTAWVGEADADELGIALTAYLAADDPSPDMSRRLTNALVRPFHRAIICQELCIRLDAADVDAQIGAKLEEIMAELGRYRLAGMADSDEGRTIIGRIGAAGLRALGDDPGLPARARLRPVLRGTAEVVLADTQPGPIRWAIRVGFAAAVVALLATPFVLHHWWSGTWVTIVTAVCAAVVGAMLLLSVLVLPSQSASRLRRLVSLTHLGVVQSAAERASDELP